MCYKKKHIINLIDQEKILFFNDNFKLDNLNYVKFLIKNDLYTDFFLWLNNNLYNKIDIQLYFFVKNNFNNKNNKTADFIINNFKY